jgi:hypothetical protein
VDQAVNTFVELLKPVPGLMPGDVQRRAAKLLPERLMQSAMDWWPVDAAPNGPGNRLLIGIAVWSTYDLRLLDLVNEAIHSGHGSDIPVGVFDIDRVASEEALARLVPGIGLPPQTPIVGYWLGGQLKEVASGFAARQLVAGLFGLDPKAILERRTPSPV